MSIRQVRWGGLDFDVKIFCTISRCLACEALQAAFHAVVHSLLVVIHRRYGGLSTYRSHGKREQECFLSCMQFQLGRRIDLEGVDGQFEGRGGWRRERRALSMDRYLVSPVCSPVS